MAEKLNSSASKKAILDRVVFLIANGQTLTGASALVESETGQKARTTISQYWRAREVVARTWSGTMKAHGNRKLTERQEKMLVATLMVSNGPNETTISAGELMKHVEKLFGVSVSRAWAKRFLTNKEKDNTKWKAKLPMKKRVTTQVQASDLIGDDDYQDSNKRDCVTDKDEELENSGRVAEKAATKDVNQNCGSTHANRDEEMESLRIEVKNLTRRNEELDALLKKMIFIADDAVKKVNSLEGGKKCREDVDNSGEEELLV